MLHGLLTEQKPMTTYREREAQRYLHLLDETDEVQHYSAVKTLRIRLLGEFELLANDLPLSGLEVPRLQSLLAYLALRRGIPQARARIAYTLWPDSTDAQAHTNLRNLLFKLRLTLPEVDSFLVVERQTLCWQPDALWSLDVQDFETALARAEQAHDWQDAAAERQALEAAIQLYRGDLLPGCYDEWIGAERDRLQQLYQGALERLLELLEQEENYAGAIRIAQRLLRLDPLREATYRHMMRLHAARGDRCSILRTYQNCAAVLKRELAVQPGLKTRKTYEQLMRAED
jgi:DNA-binding SARP family transcriptional activator